MEIGDGISLAKISAMKTLLDVPLLLTLVSSAAFAQSTIAFRSASVSRASACTRR